MKRIIGLLFIALSLSCCSKSETDKEGGGNYVLSITPQNLKFPANGDSQNVIVASNGQWSLSGGDSWKRSQRNLLRSEKHRITTKKYVVYIHAWR